MRLFLLLLLVTLVSCSTVAYGLSDDIIKDIFTAPTTASEVSATSSKIPTTLLEKKGDARQCVPYYMCGENNDETIEDLLVLIYEDRIVNPCTGYMDFYCPINQILQVPQPDPAKVKGCGYRNIEGFGLRFLDSKTKFGEFPWVVALLDSNNTYVGAGVIISPNVVMTVAHIAKRFTPGTLRVRAGEWDTFILNEIFEHQERKVNDTYIHEEFHPIKLRNDIALLRLEQPLHFAEHINAICLPEQDEVFENYKGCIYNGWGKDLFGKEYADVLKKVEQDIVPHDECERLMRKIGLRTTFNLHDSFVCASKHGQNNCEADGGAALACPVGNNRYKLTGLVAWGIRGCGHRDIPGIPAGYTNVPKFRRWVDEKMAAWGYTL